MPELELGMWAMLQGSATSIDIASDLWRRTLMEELKNSVLVHVLTFCHQ